MDRPTEEQIGIWTKTVLEAAGWSVYEEVQPYQGGAIADMVATRGSTVLVVELKRTLTLELMGQALGWINHADLVAVVVPRASATAWCSNARRFAIMSAAKFGIGVYTAWPGHRHAEAKVWEKSPCFPLDPDPKKKQQLLGKLRVEHQDGEWARAGTRNGKRVTDFQLTAKRLAEAVKQKPGQKIRVLLPEIEYHYVSPSSAAQCLTDCIRRNVIDSVRIEADGTLWPVDTASDSGHD